MVTRKAFEETSFFDQETGQRFRQEVLAVSGAANFMDMRVNFSGREPEIDPLLRNLGLQEAHRTDHSKQAPTGARFLEPVSASVCDF